MRVGPWIPPLAWMGVVFWLSTGSFSAERTGAWIVPLLKALLPWATSSQLELLHWLGRKTAHVLEYAILAGLWQRAFVKSGPAGWRSRGHALAAFGLTVAYAIFDEIHQGWTGQRSASARDVVLDAFAGGAALVVSRWGWRRAAERVTALLLWFAAGGGSLLLLIFVLAGAPARWLWASTPLAWLALWGWRRRERRLDGGATRSSKGRDA